LSPADIAEIIRLAVEQRFYEQVLMNKTDSSSIGLDEIKNAIEKLRNQNGNTNHIFRDISVPGLNTLIE
jgi:hypothetical protein